VVGPFGARRKREKGNELSQNEFLKTGFVRVFSNNQRRSWAAASRRQDEINEENVPGLCWQRKCILGGLKE
jgi:hypothetical protein